MGLLGKAIANNNDTAESAGTERFDELVVRFYRKRPLFHCIVLQGRGDIAVMLACYGGAYRDLPGGSSLVLLPGTLDRELFAHRLSRSTGSAVLSQFSANSAFLALKILRPYLR